MPKKPKKGQQLDMLPKSPAELPQHSFNLSKLDDFITGLGVKFLHYRAMPSPIGLKDKGEYRRPDALDDIQENGMLYEQCGEFTAVILGNNKSNPDVEGGVYDQSMARITLPRFYDADSPSHANEEINLCPGDRLFIKECEVKIATYQLVEYIPGGEDFLQFPALEVESLRDSRNIKYKEGVHFKINEDGNIVWKAGAKNPGIDEDTGKGRTYTIRYKYNAHWYVASILNEVRITNITVGNTRQPARMPYHAMIQREYAFHNRINKTNVTNTDISNKTERTISEPTKPMPVDSYQVKVNIGNFEDE